MLKTFCLKHLNPWMLKSSTVDKFSTNAHVCYINFRHIKHLRVIQLHTATLSF